MRFYIIIIVSCLGHFLFAQGKSDENVRAMFEKEDKIQWIKHYKGRLNDMNDVAITLGYDGKDLKGEMTYLRSKVHFFLVGEMKKNRILLQEYDANSLVTGYIKGEIKENIISGEWQNFNNTLGATIALEEIADSQSKLLELPTYCGDNKWVRFYEGKLGKKRAHLILQKNGGERVTGMIRMEGETGQRVDGYYDSFSNLHLSIKNEMLKEYGRLEGSFDSKNRFNVNYIDAKKQEYACTFNLEEQLSLGGVEYSDYIASYDILYPKIQNDAFTKWMDDIVNGWTNSCRNYVEDIEMRANPKPDTRYSIRANAWTELSIVDKELVSGQIRFMNTWETRPISRNLNFDLKRGKEILAQDIFIEDFNYKKYVKKYLINRLLQHKWAEDQAYRDWLDQQEFSTFNFRQDGMYFSTDYNPVFGRQEVIVPYKKLRHFFKKHPIIEKCLKGKF